MENPPVKTKYYFNDLSLSRFCDINGYPYLAIWNRIKTLQAKNDLLSTEQIVTVAIKKYENRLHIDKINEIFSKLERNEVTGFDELNSICEFLNIDFENVLDLINMNFSYSQAINIIWFFSDNKNTNNFKIITDKKLQDLFSLVNEIKNNNEDIEKLELYDLIGIYKCKLYDTRNEILLKQKRYIYHTMYSLCRNYGVEVNKSNMDDFLSEIKMYLIIVINRTNLNNYGQILKYMDLTIKGNFRTYLKQYKKQNGDLSLNDTKYSKDRGTKNAKSRIDYIADPNNSYEDLEVSAFSSSMMQILSDLSKQDMLFIMLKFQENYNDDELAEYFNFTLEEVREKEIGILTLLKDNPGIKRMIKRK